MEGAVFRHLLTKGSSHCLTAGHSSEVEKERVTGCIRSVALGAKRELLRDPRTNRGGQVRRRLTGGVCTV